MATIGSIWINIGAKTGNLRKSLRSAEKSIQRFRNRMNESIASVARWGSLIGGAAAVGVAALIKRTADAGDKIDKMSKRTGLMAKTLSQLGYAAGLSRTDMESIEKAARTLAKTAYDASRGMGSAKDVFRDLGVEVHSTDGKLKDINVLFRETMGAVAGVENMTERAALASQVFGRAGTQLLPMLTDGTRGLEAMMDEARKLGFVWTYE